MVLWLLIWCLGNMVYAESSVEYPNPQLDWRLCGQERAAYVCDPDFILDRGDVEKLDKLAEQMKASTKCLCSKCSDGTGIQIGIYIKHNISQELLMENPGKSLAEKLRKTWNLGSCDDDIIIVLITQLNISGFSLGSSLQTILPEETAGEILRDCHFHFDFGYFAQGLESMMNSFYDIIVREQGVDEESEGESSRQLLTGLFIGFAALIALMACLAAFRLRQQKRRKQSCSNIYEKEVQRGDVKNEVKEQMERLNKHCEVEIEDA